MKYILVSLILLIPLNSIAASFNCSKAGNTLEKTICNSVSLNAIDEKLGKIYKKLYKSLANEDFQALKKEQLAWLKTRSNCKVAINCLLKKYQIRIKELEIYGKKKSKVNKKTREFKLPVIANEDNFLFKITWKQDNKTKYYKPVELVITNANSSISQIIDIKIMDINYQDIPITNDYNFDNYQDLYIANLIFLFDGNSKQFIKNNLLSMLPSPTINKDKKLIVVKHQNNLNRFYNEFYKFSAKKTLILYGYEQQIPYENSKHKFLYKNAIRDELGKIIIMCQAIFEKNKPINILQGSQLSCDLWK
jgi:uncharacterized protein